MSGAAAPLRVVGEPVPARGLDDAEKAEHLRNAPLRADDAIQASKAYRRTGWVFGLAGSAALCAGAGALGAAVWTWRPAEPVYGGILPDGTVQPLLRAVQAPERFTDATAKQYLRMYLDVCEHYQYDAARLRARRCALLLSPQQQEAYARWFAPSNPDGFQGAFGRGGSVSVADRVTYTKYGQQGRTQVWTARFVRVEYKDRTVRCRPWQATLSFQFRPELPMGEEDRTWNLAGMQITDRTSQPDPSAPPETRCS